MEDEKVRACVFFILDFFVYNVCVCMYGCRFSFFVGTKKVLNLF